MTTTDLPPERPRPRDPEIDLTGDVAGDLAGEIDAGPDPAESVEATEDGPDAGFEDEHLELDVFDDVVDPRMRERWVATRRAEGQRRLRIIAGLVGFLAVGLIAYVAANSALLGARDIVVKGNTRTGPDAIRAAAGIKDGAPLLFLDEREIERRVERVPMVARASVSTELPSTVTISVSERTPIAWTAATPAPWVAVLDADGRVIERLRAPPVGLLHVVGPEAGAAGTTVADAALLGALERMPEPLRARTEWFGMRSTGPVLVLTDATVGAREVRLGDLSRIGLKSAAALAVLDVATREGVLHTYLDVRVPEAPVTR